ncbi:hypothetical protein [Mesorhizobium sp. M4B.F.Ca.ET.058.02.1.1]|uniref:hypothetical protein n=1 Tax=Mesorhizobium sp. M4B.F.Ca.ET.058.02.1.1 TaxID=2493675 RepID=UPI000F75CC2C|nr:hypothetical protein [Mesorhizobium sp. M4B.F.Ca.ET.058.02.1.1]AZO48016.1 hypothetical protein EJ073_09445 [Mesorhizobium sp. M4B.F.Ca.ET.058.02.1.1]
MSMFTAIEGGQVLLTNRGVYQEAKLYKREGELFAQIKQGFARLLASNLTTAPGIRWKAIDGFIYAETAFGPQEPIPEEPKVQPRTRKLRAI